MWTHPDCPAMHCIGIRTKHRAYHFKLTFFYFVHSCNKILLSSLIFMYLTILTSCLENCCWFYFECGHKNILTHCVKVCIIRLLFWKIFVDSLTSTLLRAQNTTLLSKVWQRFFSNFMTFSENPNFIVYVKRWPIPYSSSSNQFVFVAARVVVNGSE